MNGNNGFRKCPLQKINHIVKVDFLLFRCLYTFSSRCTIWFHVLHNGWRLLYWFQTPWESTGLCHKTPPWALMTCTYAKNKMVITCAISMIIQGETLFWHTLTFEMSLSCAVTQKLRKRHIGLHTHIQNHWLFGVCLFLYIYFSGLNDQVCWLWSVPMP